MAIGYLFSLVAPLYTLFFVALQPLPQSFNSMPLKYQKLIEQKRVSRNCPDDNSKEMEINAFRWVVSPIENSENFLPYFPHCELKKRPIRTNSTDDKFTCSACGLSMFKTLTAAKEKYKGIPSPAKQLLGYTHVANGQIIKNMGVVNSNPFSDHFDFFEYDGVELKNHFKIVDTL